jgi:hypothetical protein
MYEICFNFLILQKPANCKFFQWADNEMCNYERRMHAEMKRLHDKGETIRAKMENQCIQFQLKLELYQTRVKLYQSREKLYQATLGFFIIIILFYVSGYTQYNGSQWMLR